VHLSNGAASPLDRNHSEYITAMPPAYAAVRWIEVEARGKELAIGKLRGEAAKAAATVSDERSGA
jgi:UV DNA damage endonuclease